MDEVNINEHRQQITWVNSESIIFRSDLLKSQKAFQRMIRLHILYCHCYNCLGWGLAWPSESPERGGKRESQLIRLAEIIY